LGAATTLSITTFKITTLGITPNKIAQLAQHYDEWTYGKYRLYSIKIIILSVVKFNVLV